MKVCTSQHAFDYSLSQSNNNHRNRNAELMFWRHGRFPSGRLISPLLSNWSGGERWNWQIRSISVAFTDKESERARTLQPPLKPSMDVYIVKIVKEKNHSWKEKNRLFGSFTMKPSTEGWNRTHALWSFFYVYTLQVWITHYLRLLVFMKPPDKTLVLLLCCSLNSPFPLCPLHSAPLFIQIIRKKPYVPSRLSVLGTLIWDDYVVLTLMAQPPALFISTSCRVANTFDTVSGTTRERG